MSKSNSAVAAPMYKIESGIAIPHRAAQGIYATTIAHMKTGDSIVCEKEGQVLQFRAAAKAAGCSCVVRKIDNGYRVWKSDKTTQTLVKTPAKKAPAKKAVVKKAPAKTTTAKKAAAPVAPAAPVAA